MEFLFNLSQLILNKFYFFKVELRKINVEETDLLRNCLSFSVNRKARTRRLMISLATCSSKLLRFSIRSRKSSTFILLFLSRSFRSPRANAMYSLYDEAISMPSIVSNRLPYFFDHSCVELLLASSSSSMFKSSISSHFFLFFLIYSNKSCFLIERETKGSK